MKHLWRFIKPCIKNKDADYSLMFSVINTVLNLVRLLTKL